MKNSGTSGLIQKVGQVRLLNEDDGSFLDEDEMDFILSQEFFCTPDYITPDEPQIFCNSNLHKENFTCPQSPVKSCINRIKRYRTEVIQKNNFDNKAFCRPLPGEFVRDASTEGDSGILKPSVPATQKKQSYVSRSVVALGCRATPPLCIKNPYLVGNIGNMWVNADTCNEKSKKPAAFCPSIISGDGLSRYRTDFHELEVKWCSGAFLLFTIVIPLWFLNLYQVVMESSYYREIGCGNFSRVFKVLKRIDGCIYAVKHITRHLQQDNERQRALMEVQALAAIGFHPNIVGYYTSWFENDHLYIQMELCDHNLSFNRAQFLLASEGEVIRAMQQILEALQFIHERGIVHLDIKPDNIYVKDGVYKLGDFGCATLKDGSLHVEEGDARYMPLEMLNDKHDHLDKVDIFSLGASIYEVVKGFPLPASGAQFSMLRDGKLSLLPGYSLQFQNLLKVMMDPEPTKRPSAKLLLEAPLFKVNKEFHIKTKFSTSLLWKYKETAQLNS